MRNALITNWMNEVDDMVRSLSPALSSSAQNTAALSDRADQRTEKNWFSPAVDVEESRNKYLFFVDLPGMQEKDLNLKVIGRELYISGVRHHDLHEMSKDMASGKDVAKEATTNQKNQNRILRSERFFGRFERSFILPEQVDSEKIEANFKDGVLEILVPKVEAAQPKSIPIRTSSSSH